ncbi:hypothetical protein [Burkholderia oklahomensis]|nr:hypothetical protein [Burkholderia oklahomensis]AOI42747.1 hypothetical protein WG70_24640 [Burkholderia oklahomensis EO147]QPS37489.1 hypothetical protein I6G57_00935 [Burkholderia oklahomensis]
MTDWTHADRPDAPPTPISGILPSGRAKRPIRFRKKRRRREFEVPLAAADFAGIGNPGDLTSRIDAAISRLDGQDASMREAPAARTHPA